MSNVVREQPTETLGLRTKTGTAQPSFRLTITGGPDTSKFFIVDGSGPNRVFIGSGPTCDWILSDRAVSRRHFAVSLADGLLVLEDIGSTNGTFIGRLRVREVSLEGGEDVYLASTRIHVERLAADAQVAVARSANFGRVIGSSVAMRRIYPTLARLAQMSAPVLVEGEGGTGKELVAECLHEEGPRSSGELVVFDAEKTPVEQVDARLFGTATVPGAFEQARGGTLVIDEPSHLPMVAQGKLARLLERRPVVREDGSTLEPADVRLVSLSRSDVEAEIQAGRLAEALVIGAARVELPPLRDRAGDVTLLATTFFRALNLEDRFISPMTVRRFEAYAWPGNVRELKHAVVRSATTGDDTADPLGAFRNENMDGRETPPTELYKRVLDSELTLSSAREIIVEDFDRRFVRGVLERHGGNVTRAAAASGIARRYLQVLRVKRGV